MTGARAIWLVAQREILERLRTRSFLIFTAFIVLLAGGSVIAASELPEVIEESPPRLGIAGEAGPGLEEDLREVAQSAGLALELERFPSAAAGRAALSQRRIDALLVDESDLFFRSRERAALSLVVNRTLYARNLPAQLEQLGLTLEQARPLIQPEAIEVRTLDPAGAEPLAQDRRIIASLTVIVLLISLALYGNWVLMGVIEEKNSRVVEVLLGSIRPETLLAGKVVGIVVVAMVQLFAGIGAGVAALLIVGGAGIPRIALDVLIVAAAFFTLGILAYSFLYATVGATVSRQSEASTAAVPLALMLLGPYLYSLTVVPERPDSLVAQVLSILPVTSPMVMPTRVATGDPGLVEVALSVGLMLPWIALVVFVAARIYAGAILSSGPRVGFLAAWRASTESRRSR